MQGMMMVGLAEVFDRGALQERLDDENVEYEAWGRHKN